MSAGRGKFCYSTFVSRVCVCARNSCGIRALCGRACAPSVLMMPISMASLKAAYRVAGRQRRIMPIY